MLYLSVVKPMRKVLSTHITLASFPTEHLIERSGTWLEHQCEPAPAFGKHHSASNSTTLFI